MNADIKARWVAALRSGDYKQGRATMRQRTPDGDTFCCLGVLSDLAVKGGVCEWEAFNEKTYGINDISGSLPTKVMEWAGLDYCNPWLDSIALDAIRANDGDKLTFNEIATAIEENL